MIIIDHDGYSNGADRQIGGAVNDNHAWDVKFRVTSKWINMVDHVYLAVERIAVGNAKRQSTQIEPDATTTESIFAFILSVFFQITKSNPY
jgi:hypothetical protein